MLKHTASFAGWSCAALLAAAALLHPHQAQAWWYRGPAVGIVVAPPAVVVAPPVYAPPPVVYAPPPVVYAPTPRPWVPGHWRGPYWVPGHWA